MSGAHLVIKNLKGRGLLGIDKHGKSSPYLKVSLGSKSHKTSHLKDNLDPEWKESFTFDAATVNKGHKLVFKVKDSETFRDKPMGFVEVALGAMDRSGIEVASWHPLSKSEGMKKAATGDVHFTYQFVFPEGNAPAKQAAPSAAAAAPASAPGTAAAASPAASGSSQDSTPDAPSSGAGAGVGAGAVPAVKDTIAGASVFETKSDSGMAHVPNEVVVTLHRGISLLGTEHHGKSSDPLTTIHVAGHSFHTKVINTCLDPSWEESYVFPCDDESDVVKMVVESHERVLHNKFIGQAVVNVSDFVQKKRATLALVNKKGATDKPRGSIDVTVHWRYNMDTEGTAHVAESDEEDEGGDDASSVGGDSVASSDGEGGKAKKMTPEEAKAAAAEAEAAALAAKQDVQVKEGEYQIQIHLIEARDLRPKDGDGLSDPVVKIEVMGQKHHSRVHHKTTNCVFDETLFFHFKHVTREELHSAIIKVGVFDVDTIGRDDLIGAYDFDMQYVYFQDHHEIHNQWVGLANKVSHDDEGLQGYLKLSIVVLGPGDKPFIHDPAEDAKQAIQEKKKGVAAMLLMPPTIKQSTEFLVATIHRGEHFPRMDSAKMGITKGGIDAFVTVEFAGNKRAKTKYKTIKGDENLHGAWNTQLWMPVTSPSMTNAIELALWDHELIEPNERVATAHADYHDVVRAGASGTGPRWFNLYGPPDHVSGPNAKHMQLYPGDATHFRGRLLISMARDPDKKMKEPDEVHKKRAKSLAPRKMPAERRYVLRCLAIQGAELPIKRKAMGTGKVEWGLAVQIGPYRMSTAKCHNVDGEVSWKEPMQKDVELPEDVSQMPDVFVYLFHGKEGKEKDVCYARFRASELLAKGFSAPAHWVQLHEDKALDALSDDQEAGIVLLRLGLGLAEEASRNQWTDTLAGLEQRDAYQLRVHMYQARDLPAADENGSIDPYVKVHFKGTVQSTPVVRRSTNPTWYQTMAFNVELPPLHLAPLVRLAVWDHDKWGGDDRIASAWHELGDGTLAQSSFPDDALPDVLPDPTWITLRPLGNAATDDLHPDTGGLGKHIPGYGELLVGFQLIKLANLGEAAHLPAPQSIVPKTKNSFIEVIALGCRNLAPFEMQPVYLPHVEFDVGERARKAEVHRTKSSKRPSGPNPNFVERLLIPCKLPLNPLFASSLNLTVKDSRLGGFTKPVIASASIPLHDKLPWASTYKPPPGAPDTDAVPEPVAAAKAAGESKGTDVDETKAAPASGSAIADSAAGSASAGAGVGVGAAGATAVTIAPPPATAKAKKKGGWFASLKGPSAAEVAAEEQKSREAARLVITDPAIKQLNNKDLHKADGALDETEEYIIKYMKNRAVYEGDLDEAMPQLPFETYPLLRGVTSGTSLFGHQKKTLSREVGSFKGIVRVIESAETPPLFDLNLLLKPTPCVVRVYCIDVSGVQPLHGEAADPYLKLRLGKTKIDDVKHFIPNTTDPAFYKVFELATTLPGPSKLQIELWDHDKLTRDQMIGTTSIDLEDRWFSHYWREIGMAFQTPSLLAPKPLEMRPFTTPTSSLPQGMLRMWVEILTPAQAPLYKPLKIAPPPPVPFEVRLIVWRTKNVVPMDTVTHMNDMYAKVWVRDVKPQETDIHWRCKNGKGSFNWRMKFDVALPMKFPYLHLQLWDKDIVTHNDCIAEVEMDLGPHFQRALKAKGAINVFAPEMDRCLQHAVTVEPAGEEESKGQPAPGDAAAAPAASGAGVGVGAGSSSSSSAPKKAATAKTPLLADTDDVYSAPATTGSLNGPAGSAGAKAGAGKSSKISKSKSKKGKSSLFSRHQKGDDTESEDEVDPKEGAKDSVSAVKSMLGLEPQVHPADGAWVDLYRTNFKTHQRKNMGSVLISMEIIPKTEVDMIPAGFGRHAPNLNPVLPKPVGRFKFSFNPFFMLNEILGPALCAKVGCCLLCLVIVALCIFGAPFIEALEEFYNIIPAPINLILVILVAGLLCTTSGATALHHWCRKDKKKDKKGKKRGRRGN